MTNEEFQKLVLEKFSIIESKLTSFEKRQEKFAKQQEGFEKRQEKFDKRQEGFEKRQEKFDKRQEKFENQQDNITGQLDENTQIIKALMHNTEELNAKYDSLLNVTASKDVMERMEKKIDAIWAVQSTQGESINILAMRQLQIESEIATLRKAR